MRDDLSKRLENLSPEKRALLEQMREKRRAATTQADPIPRRPASDRAPLSFAQQRLWFLEHLVPGSAVYNMPSAVRLSGMLNIPALEHSLNAIIARHEVLRTSFKAVAGHPVQVIAPSLTVDLPLDDLTSLPPAEKTVAVEQRIVDAVQQPFDLATTPLLRARLLQLHLEDSHQEYILCLILHHIIADGWSLGVFIRELAAFYAAFTTGSAPALAELPIQYADFAVWQQSTMQSTALEAQRSYWRKQLAHLPLLALPTDRPRPPVQSFTGAQYCFELPPQLTDQLKLVSQQSSATLFMTLLATFKALLHGYTGQGEIVVGTDVAGRNQIETTDLIGFFVNQLTLRTNLAGDPTFAELLQRVRDIALAAFAHQDLPFDQLVEILNIPRDLSRTPLFQVKLVLQNAPLPPLALSGLNVQRLDVDPGTSKFDLLLNIWEEQAKLVGTLDYNTDVFERGRMARLMELYQQLLAVIAVQPTTRLSTLAAQVAEREQQHQQRQIQERKTSNIQRLHAGRRRAASAVPGDARHTEQPDLT